jgi:hypothetical protein
LLGVEKIGQQTEAQPFAENLYELRRIVADITRAVDQSPYVSAQVKATLRECTRQLEAECATFKHLTQLAHRAANDAANVLRSRTHFFEALNDRILELSRLRESFVDSRRAFHRNPTELLTEEIRNCKQKLLEYPARLITYPPMHIIDSQRPRPQWNAFGHETAF